MDFLNNWRIRTRLWLAFAAVLGLMVIMVVLGVRGAITTERDFDEFYHDHMGQYIAVADLHTSIQSTTRSYQALPLAPKAERDQLQAEITRLQNAAQQQLDAFNSSTTEALQRKLLTQIQTQFQQATKLGAEFAKLASEADPANATSFLHDKLLPALVAVEASIGEFQARSKQLAQQHGEEAAQDAQHTAKLNGLMGGLALVLGLVGAWGLIHSIMQPLEVAKQAALTMSTGDLTQQIPVHGRNEVADMLASLDHMRESLAHVLFRIQQRSDQVAVASSQIAAANLDLSSRTEQQASSLQQTAATMETIAHAVHHTSDNTGSARLLAEQASSTARNVGDLMGHVLHSITAIHSSSQRIRDIVSMIDAIAFQTNILALNAAVEAARAGDHGSGFAVVATEVRALAQRSANAAHEVRAIIEDNVTKMDQGSQHASQAEQALGDVLRRIEQVATTIASVDSASQQQSIGVGQIGQAVNQLDSVTQQNAALVEETAAATRTLDEQVQGLKMQIQRFRIFAEAERTPDFDHP